MPQYRRYYHPGGTWFFTLNLLDRKATLLTDYSDQLRQSFRWTMQRWPFTVDAIVVLPDHLHAVISLPEGDVDFSTRWRFIKDRFSRSIAGDAPRSASRIKRRERGIWQRRFWEHFIRDEDDHQQHIDYCYINPVKHRLVDRVRDWPYSSFHKDVEAGLVDVEWGGDVSGITFLDEYER